MSTTPGSSRNGTAAQWNDLTHEVKSKWLLPKDQTETQPREAKVRNPGLPQEIPLATWKTRGRTPDSTPEYPRKRRKTKKEKQVIRTNVWMKLLTSVLLTAVTAFPQSSNHDNLARYTPYFVGALYAIYMTFETPLSGMSMNPARTFGSAFHASYWHALRLYFLAPTLGMLVAAKVFLRARSGAGPNCAKLHHANNKRCIFHHGYRATEIQNF